jgi:spermidine synthase
LSRARLLLLNVAVVAGCALVYELVAGTLASYVLGDAVTEFALVLGIYLSAMGAGAWASRGLAARAARRYVEAELALSVLGGASAPALMALAHAPAFRALLYGDVFAVGALVGLELPLLMRVLQRDLGFRDLVSRALFFDYAGALAASLLFPIALAHAGLGLVRTSLAAGLANAVVALSATWLLRPAFGEARDPLRALRGAGVLLTAALLVALARAGSWTALTAE